MCWISLCSPCRQDIQQQRAAQKMMQVFNQVKPHDLCQSLRCFLLPARHPSLRFIFAGTNSPLRQVSGCVAGALDLKWPVADNREEHVRPLQEVQQQHGRRDHPLLYTGGNAAGLLSLDIRVLLQRTPGAWYARYFSPRKHTRGSWCKVHQSDFEVFQK